MTYTQHIPSDILNLYEVHDYNHAAVILKYDFPKEFDEIIDMLRRFRLDVQDILDRGGSESNIPRRVSSLLRDLGWREGNLRCSISVEGVDVRASDTHKIDYVKGRVAFDLEWNSKDQTYDRDLFAFRTFHEYQQISVAILMTRSNDLDDVFRKLGRDIVAKYGASTTHMGKLLPRLEAGRGGGCPILVVGIKSDVIANWNGHPLNV